MTPFKFKTILKPTIWGAERWVLSGVPGNESACEDGRLLSEIVRELKGALVGEANYAKFGDRFPLLAKFIDAHQDLSVQVHPDDALAARRHGSPGKTEMWYVIGAEEGAKIRSGFVRPIDPARYGALVAGDGRALMDAIAVHDAHPGDAFMLPAGTVHAIGAGTFLAEIQETSDVTYRLYDYGRLGTDGKPRQLHVEEARDAIDFSALGGRTEYDRAQRDAELARCDHFTVNRIFVDGSAEIDRGVDSFVIVMCLEGEATVNGASCKVGETLLVPACDRVLRLGGKATLLTAHV